MSGKLTILLQKKMQVAVEPFNFLLLPANIQYFSVLINGQLSKGCRFDALRDLRDTRLALLCSTSSPGSSRFSIWRRLGRDPGTQQITCLQRGWRCIQNGGYGERGEKNWVRDAKVKVNKMAEKAEVQFKKK